LYGNLGTWTQPKRGDRTGTNCGLIGTNRELTAQQKSGPKIKALKYLKSTQKFLITTNPPLSKLITKFCMENPLSL
jgi:hypothetical protein